MNMKAPECTVCGTNCVTPPGYCDGCNFDDDGVVIDERIYKYLSEFECWFLSIPDVDETLIKHDETGEVPYREGIINVVYSAYVAGIEHAKDGER